MENNNYNGRKKVARQSWKPNRFLKILHTLWIGAFSAFKVVAGAVATVLLIIGVCAVVFVGILAGYLENDIIPMSKIQLESFDLDRSSYAYYTDSDGNIQKLQNIYASMNREWIEYEDIPDALIQATVAIEDKRFYEHQGVDWFTTIKACINMFLGSNSEFGGSSITQQLIKNLTTEDAVTVQRKVLEIFRATEFERRYEKEDVLEWYLNTIYLGQRRYGVKAAAAIYFGKEVENLTIAECASLISITNNPSLYNPYRTSLDKGGKNGLERNLTRQKNVLAQMREQGWISEEEYQEAISQELVLKWGIDEEDRIAVCSSTNCGYKGTVSTLVHRDDGQYACPQCSTTINLEEDASQAVYSWFVDTLLEDVAMALAERDGVEWTQEARKIYMELVGRGGYHIYSTLNMDVQNAIDRIYNDLDEIPEARSVQQLQSAIVVIDNETGNIVGMSGGVGQKNTFDAYNRATDAMLQPGSSIKPLTVYGPAFEMGVIHPGTIIEDLPLYFVDEDSPFPRNDNRTYTGANTILEGVVWSVNAIAVNTLNIIGTNYSYDFAKNKLHLDTLTDHYVNSAGKVFSDVNYSPLAMGAPTVGISVLDMTEAYATFANDGVFREAKTFIQVYDSEGNPVFNTGDQALERIEEKVFSEKTINYMNYCLDEAVARGSGTAGDFAGHDIAAKTGTTNDTKDRWFCGFTDYYTACVWVGYDNPETINLVGDQSNPAGRLWKKVMEPIHEGLERVALYDPSKMIKVSVCKDCNKMTAEACDYELRDINNIYRTQTVLMYEEDAPLESCDCHVMVDYCSVCNAVASEYCRRFAKVGETNIIPRSLVKMTQKEIDRLLEAEKFGLEEYHLMDNIIYLIQENGKDGVFYGVHGDANKGLKVPYLVCTVHTKKAWDAYLRGEDYLKVEQTEPTETTQPEELPE